jgi:hypothetical protein
MKTFLLRVFTWWNGQTLNTQLWTWLYGEVVGEDDRLRQLLWETIDRLFARRIVLDFTDHLSDRELYAVVRRDILPAAVKRVDLPDNYFHWDCSAGDAEDMTVWLTYYASEQEREQWQLEEGRDAPERETDAIGGPQGFDRVTEVARCASAEHQLPLGAT